MLLRLIYDEKLAQASYLVGCPEAGEALVIDPNRDVEEYVRAAEREELRIAHVTETHIHADFVSGLRELAARTGATMYLSDEGGPDWRYEFARSDGAVLLKHGDEFRVGSVRVEALHTPGHTPEHLSFRITDSEAADRPMGIFSGDFIFVGDVGRPDLLERAARIEGTMEKAARQLYRSLQTFADEPDYLQIWPGHGAGSACGKALGAVPQSTLGYERMVNWAFAQKDEESFVAAVLAGQPEPPKYFAQMKRINREGPLVLGGWRRPERLPESRLAELLQAGALVVDTRHYGDFADGHAPGTINIPLDRQFNTWAGWLIPYDRDFYLVVDDERGGAAVDEAVRDLILIGLDRVAGYFGSAALESWAAEGRQLETTHQITVDDLAARPGADGITLVDVRGSSEWVTGYIDGATSIPLGYLTDRLDQLPDDGTLVLQCQTGRRSMIGASLLQARGYSNVANLSGGIRAWQNEGHPVRRD